MKIKSIFKRQTNPLSHGKGWRRTATGYGHPLFRWKGVLWPHRGVCGIPFFPRRKGGRGADRVVLGAFAPTDHSPSAVRQHPFASEGDLLHGVMVSVLALLIATPAFATDPDPAAQKTVASKAYVDTKQDKITTGLVEFDDAGVTATVPALVVTNSTGTALNGNTIGFLDLETFDNLNAGLDELPDTLVPSVALISNEFDNIWNNMPAQWTALTWAVNSDNGANRTNAINAYNTTFGTGTNNWAGNDSYLINGQFLANSLALKQNKIPVQNTNLVIGQQVGNNGVPSSVIAPTATAGVVQQVALWDADGWDGASWDIWDIDDDAEALKIRRSIPTVGAVEVGLALKQNKLPAKSTGNAAPKGNQAVVLGTAGNPSWVYTTAGKDLALTAKSGAQRVMNYVDGTTASATFATRQGLTEADVKSTLVSLELLKDVYSELNTKITNNALPTGTTGTVVTYNGTNATTGVQEFSEKAVTGTITYTNGALDNANNIATIAAVGTRQKKKECAGYEPAPAGQPAHDGTHPGDEDYCWLWIFPDD